MLKCHEPHDRASQSSEPRKGHFSPKYGLKALEKRGLAEEELGTELKLAEISAALLHHKEHIVVRIIPLSPPCRIHLMTKKGKIWEVHETKDSKQNPSVLQEQNPLLTLSSQQQQML